MNMLDSMAGEKREKRHSMLARHRDVRISSIGGLAANIGKMFMRGRGHHFKA